MTDRLDELQRLHDAATKGWRPGHICGTVYSDRDETVASYWIGGGGFWDDYDRDVAIAARNALPALLRVARAAAEFADDVFDYRFGGKTPCVDIGQLVSKWIDIRVEITKWSELRAALAELRGTT